ncbi:MFS transporter [Phenylobacterium soli]|uniref:MFS transporter n=1 Tax=Phenylobacterium soli TaxID=2170551 RepID=A0A328AAS1_9CAUL|nr:MFS transporter [Phenylobacterium soli]RAK51782.1 MFS transporter [Phenylobacterium soli]
MSGDSRGHAKAGLIVALCFVVAALEGYDIQAFGVAAPKLAPALGLAAAQQGWAASAAMIGLVIGALFGGAAADRVGRKPVLIVSVLLFGAFSVVTGLVASYPMLMAVRIATGLGLGGAMPNLIAIATEISPPNRRAATVTTMFCGMPAGGAVVALMARTFGPALGWREIFVIGGVLPLLIVPAVALLLEETRPAQEEGVRPSALPALFGAPRRAAATLLLWTVFMLTLVVLYLMLNWLPTLVVAKGLTPADGAAASLSFNLTSIVGALLLGVIADRFGFRWPLLVTYVALGVAMEGLSNASGVGPILILSGLAGFLVIGAQYALYALAPVYYGPQVRAAGAGAAVGVGRLGSIAGPLIAGQLRASGATADQVLAAMLPVVVVAGAAAFLLTFVGQAHED